MKQGERDWQRDSYSWLEFAARLPSKSVPFNTLSGNQLMYSGRCLLRGATWNNAGTAAGTVIALDGVDNTGNWAFGWAAAASGIGGGTLPSVGILMTIGVFLRVAGATVSGSVLVVPLDTYPDTPPVWQ